MWRRRCDRPKAMMFEGLHRGPGAHASTLRSSTHQLAAGLCFIPRALSLPDEIDDRWGQWTISAGVNRWSPSRKTLFYVENVVDPYSSRACFSVSIILGLPLSLSLARRSLQVNLSVSLSSIQARVDHYRWENRFLETIYFKKCGDHYSLRP